MIEGWPRFSVVINTLNRAATLPVTLESLRWLGYPGEFEVVVVGGPSTDATDRVLEAWDGRVKVERCAVANLAVSRNIGIAAATGDIVAFLDDDAVPEPEWLTELSTAYEDRRVGAAGGFVFDHTGVAYQSTFSSFNRLGDPVDSHGLPADGMVFPFSFTFPHLIGTNTSFRRDALLDVGGFDEEYEYFLDDTDVVVRVMDRGWGVAQVAGAHVHHKFAPSNIRGPERVARDRYSVLKNRTYFSSRFAAAYFDEAALRRDQLAFAELHGRQLRDAAERGLVDDADVAAFDGYRDRAIDTGRAAAERGAPLVAGEDWRSRPPRPFHPFETLVDGESVRVALLPGRGGTVPEERAIELARAGRVPHALVVSDDPPNVDFRDGVWWHSVPRSGGEQAIEREVRRLRSRFRAVETV